MDNIFFKNAGRSFILEQVMGSSNPHILLYKPWTIITNFFVHAGIMHLLFNMIFLYVFGDIVRSLIGDSKIIPIFFLSALFGFLLFVLAYNFIPLYKTLGGATICGASGGIMGIVFAAVTISPNYQIRLILLGNVKIKWIALFYAFMDVMALQGGNAGGSIAHLGGALVGFAYIRQLQNGRDFGRPFYLIEDLIDYIKKPKQKIRIIYKQEEKVAAGTRQQNANRDKNQSSYQSNKQEHLDEILDKINQSGYDSLTSEEKAFLFKISQED